MAIVNKFNVNKQQVTLDADIIENMSANDVSYDTSTQYDENTVGDKISELENEIEGESITLNIKNTATNVFVGSGNIYVFTDGVHDGNPDLRGRSIRIKLETENFSRDKFDLYGMNSDGFMDISMLLGTFNIDEFFEVSIPSTTFGIAFSSLGSDDTTKRTIVYGSNEQGIKYKLNESIEKIINHESRIKVLEGDMSSGECVQYTSQQPTDEQKHIARQNIGALSEDVIYVESEKTTIESLSKDSQGYTKVLFSNVYKSGSTIEEFVSATIGGFYLLKDDGSPYIEEGTINKSKLPYTLAFDVIGIYASEIGSIDISIKHKYKTSVIEKINGSIKTLQEETENIEDTIQLYENLCWKGKTIAVFGDSITHMIPPYPYPSGVYTSYSDLIAKITGANVVNCGIGGATLSERVHATTTPTS